MPLDYSHCPKCGADIEMPTNERVETDLAIAMVMTDPGTFNEHLRDAHPEEWERLAELRRRTNANPYIGGMPRKMDGTFLRPGEDVTDVATRSMLA